MKIFILYNKIKANSYADALFQWLLQLSVKQNFIVNEIAEVKQIGEANSNSANTAFVFRTGKKDVSFFARLKLQSVIKKEGFNCLVQVTDTKPFSINILQLIISNDVQKVATGDIAPHTFFAVCSDVDKQQLIEQNRIPAESIKLIPVAAEDTFQPITWSEQQAIKMKYTQGREYFITKAEGKTLSSFTDLLKAFSTFKKWQLSSMKLVVAGKLSFTQNEEWKEKIGTYKFREDVVLLDKISDEEEIGILAGAYAFIHMPSMENDVLPLLQAMKCETPSLSFSTKRIEEYACEAAIVIEPNNYDTLAGKMILIYKDEALRSRLIAEGKETSEQYSKEKTFAALGNALSLPFINQ